MCFKSIIAVILLHSFMFLMSGSIKICIWHYLTCSNVTFEGGRELQLCFCIFCTIEAGATLIEAMVTKCWLTYSVLHSKILVAQTRHFSFWFLTLWFFSAEGAYSYGFGKKLAKKNAQNLKFEFFKKCCSQPMGDLQIKRWCFAPNQRTPNPNGVVFTTCFALTLLLAFQMQCGLHDSCCTPGVFHTRNQKYQLRVPGPNCGYHPFWFLPELPLEFFGATTIPVVFSFK